MSVVPVDNEIANIFLPQSLFLSRSLRTALHWTPAHKHTLWKLALWARLWVSPPRFCFYFCKSKKLARLLACSAKAKFSWVATRVASERASDRKREKTRTHSVRMWERTNERNLSLLDRLSSDRNTHTKWHKDSAVRCGAVQEWLPLACIGIVSAVQRSTNSIALACAFLEPNWCWCCCCWFRSLKLVVRDGLIVVS